MKAELKHGCFLYRNQRFFITGGVELGSYGSKKGRTISPHGQLNTQILKTLQEKATLDFECYVGAGFKGGAKVPVLAKGEVQFESSHFRKARLVLNMVDIYDGEVKDQINNAAGLLKDLKNLRDARVIDKVFIVEEALISSGSSMKGALDVSATIQTVQAFIGVSGKKATLSNLNISKGAVLAFQMLKPVWNKSKTEIIRLDTDLAGIA